MDSDSNNYILPIAGTIVVWIWIFAMIIFLTPAA